MAIASAGPAEALSDDVVLREEPHPRDDRRPPRGERTAQAIGEGDAWRGAPALVAFRALLASPFFQKALARPLAAGWRVDAERAIRVGRASGAAEAVEKAAPPHAA
jgi:hypothetical protein